MRTFKRVCVYCGSSNEVADHFKAGAAAVGRLLAERGIGLVYGGGRVGLMGSLADAAMAAGGQVIGVIPDKLMAHELGHEGITELLVVSGMHPRKMMMATLADAFIALPGGIGTLEELFEVLSWTQLNFHHKPVGLLNVAGYYDHLLAFMAHAGEQGFVRGLHRDLLVHADDPAVLLERLATAEIPDLGRWMVEP